MKEMNTDKETSARIEKYLQKQEREHKTAEWLQGVINGTDKIGDSVINDLFCSSYRDDYEDIPGCEELIEEAIDLHKQLKKADEKETDAIHEKIAEIDKELEKRKAENEKPIEFDNSWMADFFAPKKDNEDDERTPD